MLSVESVFPLLHCTRTPLAVDSLVCPSSGNRETALATLGVSSAGRVAWR